MPHSRTIFRAVDEQFRDPSAHAHAQRVFEVLAAHDVAVLLGQGHRDPERHAARDDRDLVQRIGLVEHVGQYRVAALVKGDALALVVLEDHGVALLTHQDPVPRGFEVLHADRG